MEDFLRDGERSVLKDPIDTAFPGQAVELRGGVGQQLREELSAQQCPHCPHAPPALVAASVTLLTAAAVTFWISTVMYCSHGGRGDVSALQHEQSGRRPHC